MLSLVLCATSFAMPIADESIHSAMSILHPHRSATCILYVALRCPIPPPKKKKFAPSLTGDINRQSSHWNNGKMKIAYNCAYVQKETFKFHLAWQAIVVLFLCLFNLQVIAMPNTKY